MMVRKVFTLVAICLTVLQHVYCEPFYENPFESPQRKIDLRFGDIMLTPEQKAALNKGEDMGGTNSGYSVANGNNLRWTDAVIPYSIDCSLENLPEAIDSVVKAMKEWEAKTCIRFVKRTNEKYFLNFFRNTHCWGNVGMTSYTRISVGHGCEHQHVMTHEIGHAVGLYHEQNRKDRDQWVKVHWENIAQFKDAFDIVKETSSLGIPYDYESIMHYPWNAFSSNGKDTMTPIKPLNGKTPYIELSKGDAQQVSIMYNCPAIEKKRANARTRRHVGDIENKQDASDCVDKNKYCADWARIGHCALSEYVREHCKMSCLSPSCKKVTCKDERPECPTWKEWGHCSLNPTVAKYCQLSCNPLCQGGVTTTSAPVTTTPVSQTTTSPPDTTPIKPTVSENGHETNPPTITPSVLPNRVYLGIGILCIDTHASCPTWAQQGKCESNPRWFLRNCGVSCKSDKCDKTILKPPGQCANPLGLAWDGKSFKIPDSAFSSPSHLSPGSGWHASAMNARLYFEDDYTNKRIGSWCAGSHQQVGYVQVDLGQQKSINYIATQGRHKYFERVSKFEIEYSNDGNVFTKYSEDGLSTKTFDGNCDHRTPVLNHFKKTIKARYVRFVPTESNFPCVRMELYGC